MQISDCLSCNKPGRESARGFTLIEILVVLFIVTILVGITVARLPSFATNADFDAEARRLQLLLNMARSEAVLDSMEYGFRLTNDGYEFLRFDDVTRGWRTAVSPFHVRRISDDLSLTVRADSPAFQLQGKGIPPVLILSSGEVTPFELVIEARDGSEKILRTDGYSRFAWKDDERR